jgi:tetratricopeptide (TPR) repeat protein
MATSSESKAMFGKVSNALIRKEADIYLEQGLHVEALELFKKFLSSYPKMSPNIRAAVEEKIRQIETELEGDRAETHQPLTQEHVAIIRQGWHENASADEIIVCAKALHAIGFYRDALLEFKKLIREGYSLHRIIGPIAECLAHLHEPNGFVDAVDSLVKDVFPNAKGIFSFKLSLAEHLVKSKYMEHAALLGRHLAEYQGVPATYRVRLGALAKTLKSTKATTKPAMNHDQPACGAPSPSPSAFKRTWHTLTSFGRKRLDPRSRR